MTLDDIRRLAEQVGYRFERSIEDDQWVERVYRPDGSVAIIARKPLRDEPRRPS